MLTELRNRGVGDVFFLVCDGLTQASAAMTSCRMLRSRLSCYARSQRPIGIRASFMTTPLTLLLS